MLFRSAPPAARVLQRAVRIGRGIDVTVMLLVVGRPPVRPHLAGGGGHEGTDPPHSARSLVAAVRDQTVVDGGGGQHPHQIQGHSPEGGGQTQTGSQQQQAAQVGSCDEHGAKAVQDAACGAANACGQCDGSQGGLETDNLTLRPGATLMGLALNPEQWQSLGMLALAVIPVALLWWAWLRLLP